MVRIQAADKRPCPRCDKPARRKDERIVTAQDRERPAQHWAHYVCRCGAEFIVDLMADPG